MLKSFQTENEPISWLFNQGSFHRESGMGLIFSLPWFCLHDIVDSSSILLYSISAILPALLNFHVSCSFLVAPNIAVVTFGLLMHHAIDNVANEVSNSFATSPNFRTLPVCLLPSIGLSANQTLLTQNDFLQEFHCCIYQ